MSRGPEVASRADFTAIRYAQCWEDADVLLAGLAAAPEKRYLSIASAGDNSFSLLATGALQVVAVDMNPAQLACVELRRAAYAELDHRELLQLMGSRTCADRLALLQYRSSWGARGRSGTTGSAGPRCCCAPGC